MRFEGFKSRATFCVIFLTFDGDLPVLRGYTHDIVNKYTYIAVCFTDWAPLPQVLSGMLHRKFAMDFFVCIRICTQECLGLNRPPFLQKKHPLENMAQKKTIGLSKRTGNPVFLKTGISSTVAPKKKSTPHFLEPNNFSERNISDEARWSFSQMPSILG